MASHRLLAAVAVVLSITKVSAVLQMPIQSRLHQVLGKRSFSARMWTRDEYTPHYFVDVQVGTPPQNISLMVDTGSTAVWLFAPTVCDDDENACVPGSFDPVRSSSYELLENDTFRASYGTGAAWVSGDDIRDTFSISGKTVTGLTMGLVEEESHSTAGIMGLGLDLEGITYNGEPRNITLPDQLVAQGVMPVKAYSTYFTDRGSGSGTLLFGGYDAAKFDGDLAMLPFVPTPVDYSSHITRLAINWTSLVVADTHNSDETIPSPVTYNFSTPAVLDTGSPQIIVPRDTFNFLATELGSKGCVVVELPADDLTVRKIVCFDPSPVDHLEFTLGGSHGPTINVPFDELIYLETSSSLFDFDIELTTVYVLAIMDGDDLGLPIILGQPFLRSAYVLYDLTNLQAGIAQTNWDSTTSNLVDYTSTVEQAKSNSRFYPLWVPVGTKPVAGELAESSAVKSAMSGDSSRLFAVALAVVVAICSGKLVAL